MQVNEELKLVMRLQHQDVIPAHSEVILFHLNLICSKSRSDITILHQSLGALQPNTE